MDKIDPYKNKERYLAWKEKNQSQIPEISKENSDLTLRFLSDMEAGLNICSSSKKDLNFIKKIKESEIKFSVQKTLFLYSKRLTIKQIAAKREINESTVWEHLSNLIEHKQISVFKVLPKKKIFQIYSKIKNKEDKLKDIKLRIKDDSITFDEINCVLAYVKSK